MKILVVEPLKSPYEKEIDGTLENMQEIVGGIIQAIYPFDHPEIALICNDEGKLLNLPLNRILYDQNGKTADIIAGTFFLCSAPADSENFESLSEENIEKYSKRFENIEIHFPFRF